MTRDELANISMMLITHVGMAKSSAMMAIQSAKEGNFEQATTHIEEASKEITEGQKYHFQALEEDAKSEDGLKMNVLFIHAEDQMLTSQMTIELAKEFVELYKRLEK